MTILPTLVIFDVRRGLDVPDLVCVINYSCPNHLEDYVHRVGRTGRAGRKGTAYTFISAEEEQHAPTLIKALTQSKQKVPPCSSEGCRLVYSGDGAASDNSFDIRLRSHKKRKNGPISNRYKWLSACRIMYCGFARHNVVGH